jgi:two-component system, OmpR family, response regulator
MSEASGAEARVLVVDDDASIAGLVSMALRYEGFSVATAASGHEALSKAEDFRPDLVVLDVQLPDLTGQEVCARLRRQGAHPPVVYLTGPGSAEERDRGTGLTRGDDCIAKPFSRKELIARIRAALRRARGGSEPCRLELADLILDEDAHEATRQGQPLDLTPTEFKLLRYLLLNAGRVLSRAQILDHVWNHDFGGNLCMVETYVSRLRRKVDRFHPPLIHTVRHVGYVLRAGS